MADAEWDPAKRGHIAYDTEPREVTTEYLDDPHTGAMLILFAVLMGTALGFIVWAAGVSGARTERECVASGGTWTTTGHYVFVASGVYAWEETCDRTRS